MNMIIFLFLRAAGGSPEAVPMAAPPLLRWFYALLYHKKIAVGNILLVLSMIFLRIHAACVIAACGKVFRPQLVNEKGSG